MEFKELLKLETLEGHPEELQIDIIGILFDMSFDNNSLDGLSHAFNLAAQIKENNLTPVNLTILYYDLSNGWSYYRKIKYKGTQQDWQFQMQELTNEIIHLRKAIASPGFDKIDAERQCQIYTNLGNSFSFIGRFVEAQAYWDRAISIRPDFAMAIGNMANGMVHYGRSLYDNVHTNLFFAYAYHHVANALRYKNLLHEGAATGFQGLHDWLKNIISKNFPKEYLEHFPNLDDYDLGDDQNLKDYRLWCLEKKLFVNPLNDLGPHNVASHDCLNLPTVTLPANRAPVCLNLYNQIKQEFATARYSFYVSTSGGDQHFSDTDVPLVETMEMIRYSFYVEQLKISFRLAYSILDKIAYLLNDYLELQIELSKVSFRGLWYTNKQQLRPFFEKSDNWALRGLYWLSKDLYEKEMDFDAVLEPDAKEVAIIRNYIEHKGFKIVSDQPPLFASFKEPDISYTISRKKFEQKTMKLLKLTRAAIIYVSVALAHEEKKKDFTGLTGLPVESSIIPAYKRT